jgi:hypothetical protein
MSEVRGPAFGFWPNQKDIAIFEQCCACSPDSETIEKADLLIRYFDRTQFVHGRPRVDEVSAAICNAARYLFREGIQ